MITIVSCMKNEGAFAAEWIAFHKAIGIDNFVIYTNDCDDRTVDLLKALDRNGDIIHRANRMRKGESPQVAALRQAMQLDIVKKSDWMLHIDTDEFLVIDQGRKGIDHLVQIAEPADAVAILWRAFGSMGYSRYNGGLVHERYLQAQATIQHASAFHKTMFRPRSFARVSPHMPKDPTVTTRKPIVLNTAGQRMPARSFYNDRARYAGGPEVLTWENACLHHYAIRSTDLYLAKNLRGDSNHRDDGKYHLGSTYHRRYDRNEVFCDDALGYSEQFHREFERLLEVPMVRQAMRDSEDWLFNQRRSLSADLIEKLSNFAKKPVFG